MLVSVFSVGVGNLDGINNGDIEGIIYILFGSFIFGVGGMVDLFNLNGSNGFEIVGV